MPLLSSLWSRIAALSGYVPVVGVLACVWLKGSMHAQSASELKLRTGKEIYLAACAGCHGEDGKGRPQSTLGFEPPPTFPDFTDCRSASREPGLHWSAMIHDGGAARGFSEIMPSFKEALTTDEINRVIRHLRSLCTDANWPQGDLNLPRPLVTEKAFPEDEVVVSTDVSTREPHAFGSTLIIEKRAGARNNLELRLPARFAHPLQGTWQGGIGDVSFGAKRSLWHSSRTGSILSLGGEVTLPTGDTARGFGNGVTVFEPFFAYGQLLPGNSFLQAQAGVETPARRREKPAEAFLRTAVGKSMSQNHGFGRTWSPMVEFVAVREMLPRAATEWDVVPQMQVTLSRRQHIRANFGLSIPFAHTAGRATQAIFYLLWDFFDGGLREGWR